MQPQRERFLVLAALALGGLGSVNLFYSASVAATATSPARIERAHLITEIALAFTLLSAAVLMWRLVAFVRAVRRNSGPR